MDSYLSSAAKNFDTVLIQLFGLAEEKGSKPAAGQAVREFYASCMTNEALQAEEYWRQQLAKIIPS